MEEGTRIIQLGSSVGSSVTPRVATFEEAFGEYSEIRGRGRARRAKRRDERTAERVRRQERKAERKLARQQRKDDVTQAKQKGVQPVRKDVVKCVLVVGHNVKHSVNRQEQTNKRLVWLVGWSVNANNKIEGTW
jgi:hypothetical protein